MPSISTKAICPGPTAISFTVIVTSGPITMFEPIKRLFPFKGLIDPAVRVDPEAMTMSELMVTGDAPMMLDAVSVPVIQESPTT